ncbi:MAG: hypothetical protein JO219_01035 [Candidatus Eremiobacteraeota bacterium]|nr:hypothetical protein [Candidatus Eremiobacteraeota bacterium]MBV8365694.1 hypothetical protein [Candidatus Eremiobacteraeota bacterium]
MIALSVAILLFASTATTAAAPAAQPPGQLRQVTYKVSTGTRTYSGGEHYEGYSSNSTATVDNGTVIVDVTAVQSDTIGMSVTEQMSAAGGPVTYNGTVMPDGSVNFAPDTIKDVTRELLQYFGPDMISADKLTLGSTWDVNLNSNGVVAKTNYKVTKVDGGLVTLAEHQTITFSTQNATVSTEGTVTLKPSLLVPVSGDLHRTVNRLSLSGNNKTDVSLHFERVSDTLDQPAK